MRFYVLQDPQPGETDAVTDYLSADGTRRGAAPRCPVCHGYIGGKPRLPPMRFELETWGERFGDLAFGPNTDVLISERVRDAFLASGLTGFSGYTPAEIVKVVARRGKVPVPMPAYFAVVAGRSRAAIDDLASGMDYVTRWTCDECRIGNHIRLRRLALEPGTWSGEDVFIARGLPGTIIASERFKQFCDQHAFSNCVLIEAERFHFDHLPSWRPSS